MRSKTAQKLLDKTSIETKEFVSLYSDIVLRINELIAEKGYTQKELAESIGKNPSEISKWLNGDHNFTLRSIAKLQAQLGEPIICVPRKA
ncbi:transcriptional regulator, XRE family [Lunatimonas lonarensis]|uniref:Transcriptional regulator, XRE family n=1 Tax=Lunatimonas lonarensis TaxID=1232681 RepID=R7ZS61_9BACT|nr:helix-turn-helix transcriptional regulator [Lunatimonas lonarensis]EON76839.1 transcriptional regulator, XRE family [Lunatimonas lonarensis]